MRKIGLPYLFIVSFFYMTLSACSTKEVVFPDTGFREPSEHSSKMQTVVFEYMPAPGQFINAGEEHSTQIEANDFALKCLTENLYVSLGGFGGYIVVGFDHSIIAGVGYDFYVKGNSFPGSSEPGVVYVMQDLNANGLPDDTWYELKGSEYGKIETITDYVVTYKKPADRTNVSWSDNRNNKGVIDYLPEFHTQRTYYPSWITTDNYSLKGTMLANNVIFEEAANFYELSPFDWGYVDNRGADFDADLMANVFEISNAIDARGEGVKLEYIDFIKVQCAINGKAGHLGEVSTEVSGFFDAHL